MKSTKTTEKKSPLKSNEGTPRNAGEKQPVNTSVGKQRDEVRLYMIDGDKKTLVYSNYPRNAYIKVWNNLLVLAGEKEVYLLNLSTDEKITLISEEQKNSLFKDNQMSKRLNLDGIYLDQNNLYVFYGAYLATGGIVRINLLKPDEVELVYEGRNPRITNLGNDLVVTTAEGDFCWYEGTYQRISDIESFRLGPAVELSYHCGDGQNNLGFRSDLNAFLYIEMVRADDIQSSFPTGKPASIHTVNLDDFKEELVSKKQMPENSLHTIFNEKENTIYILTGNSLYVYEISNKSLRKIGDLSQELPYVTWSYLIDSGGICTGYGVGKDKFTYFIDHTTGKTISNDPKDCEITYPSHDAEIPYEEIYNIELPENYLFEVIGN